MAGSLFIQSGGLVYGTPQSGAVSENFLEKSLAVAQRNSIEHMVYEGTELREKFPQFCFADGDVGLFEPSAGYLYPERIIQTDLELAESRGATTIMGSKVQEIRKDNAVFHCRTNLLEFSADQVVLTAGAWLTEFLPDKYHSYFTVYRALLFWMECDERSKFLDPACPVHIRVGSNDEGSFYGFPMAASGRKGVKVGLENFNEDIALSDCIREVSEAEIQRASEYITKYIAVEKQCIHSAACMITRTPDQNFVIGEVPELPGLTLVSACSGHGFKHSAAIGECVAQLVCNQPIPLDIEGFAVDRLQLSAS